MKVIPQERFDTNGYKVLPGYRAEQSIENGILSYTEVTYGATSTEVVSDMLNKLDHYGLMLHDDQERDFFPAGYEDFTGATLNEDR